MDTKQYVAGFLFRNNRSEVALIQKLRPKWQAGRFNGIGGKIEPGENSESAMAREFLEETGASVLDWTFFCEINWELGRDSGEKGFVHFFVSDQPAELKTMTDEEVVWIPLQVMSHIPCVDNLSWLIPMALVALDRRDMFATVELPE